MEQGLCPRLPVDTRMNRACVLDCSCRHTDEQGLCPRLFLCSWKVAVKKCRRPTRIRHANNVMSVNVLGK